MASQHDALRRWCAWSEAQIAGVVMRERLRLGCAEVRQGPMTMTFRLRMLAPNKTDLQRLMAMGQTFAQALQVGSVRIDATADGVLVEVPSPFPATPSARHLAKHSKGLTVAVGLDSRAQPVFIDFDELPHLALVGPTRKGKTQALRAILYALTAHNSPRQVVTVIICRKASSWRLWAPLANCYGVLSDDDEIADALTYIAGPLLNGRTRDGVNRPALFVVVDDLKNVNPDGQHSGALDLIASMGGEAGVHVCLSSQSVGRAGGMSAAIESNLVRLTFGAPDAAMAARFAGRAASGADQVGTVPGDGLLITGAGMTRLATGYCPDELVAVLPMGELPKPWRTSAHHRTGPTDTPTAGMRAAAGVGHGSEPGAELVRTWPRSGPISTDERQAIRTMLAAGKSKNAVCFAAYGAKTMTAWGRLNAIIAEDMTQPAPTDQVGDVLDLDTEAGRHALAELMQSGEVTFQREATR